MKKICVMMTCYNPNEFFIQQVESILDQKGVEVDIIVRDDASTNKKYLYEVTNKYGIHLIEGKANLRTGGNILQLLKFVSENMRNYDYYAYSDQDDFWDKEKLIVAVNNLDNLCQHKPALYYSNLKVVDKNLIFKQMLFKKNIVKNTFGQSLGQVFLFACTSVFNIEMIDEILKYNFNMIGFDTCLYFLGILNKNIYYDENSYIHYRQHGNNVSGNHEKNYKYYCQKIKYYFHTKNQSVIRLNCYFINNNFQHYLSKSEQMLINRIINAKSLKDRIKIAFEKEIKVGYFSKDFFNFIKIVLNK